MRNGCLKKGLLTRIGFGPLCSKIFAKVVKKEEKKIKINIILRSVEHVDGEPQGDVKPPAQPN